jgi:hypothetical protein
LYIRASMRRRNEASTLASTSSTPSCLMTTTSSYPPDVDVLSTKVAAILKSELRSPGRSEPLCCAADGIDADIWFRSSCFMA